MFFNIIILFEIIYKREREKKENNKYDAVRGSKNNNICFLIICNYIK